MTTTPQALLQGLNREYPEVWRFIDRLRADRGKGLPDWPEHVYLPIAGWYAATCQILGVGSLGLEHMDLLQILSCAGTWRPTQDIVRFDTDVYASLASTPLDGNIPVLVLERIPAWCIYIETPGLRLRSEQGVEGFFAFHEHDMNNHERELRLFFLTELGLLPYILHIGPWDLARALEKSLSMSRFFGSELGINVPSTALQVDDGLRTAISLLLYVCAYGFEAPGEGGLRAPARPQAKKVKNGWRLYPPPQPTIRRIGETFGEQIRAARAAQDGVSHAGPRPHIRRAHWHGYWTGPHKSPEGADTARKLDLRWLPPIPVAMGDEDKEDL